MLFLNGADTKIERGGELGTRDVQGNRLLAAAVAAPIDDAAAAGDVTTARAVDAAADAAEAKAAAGTSADAKADGAAAGPAAAYGGVDVRLCDFDDVLYRVCVGTGRGDGDGPGVGVGKSRNSDFGPATAAHTLRVHMSAPFFASASGVGARAALRERYGPLLAETPAPGADVTLSVDLRTLRGAAADAKDALVQSIAQLKCTAIGGVFQHFFRALSGDAKEAVKPFAFPIRADTTVWFVPEALPLPLQAGAKADPKAEPKVHVTFSVAFRDRVDRAVALTFLREFVECEAAAQLLLRGGAKDRPKFAFTKLPPLQVANAFGLTGNAVPKGVLGYASFTVLPSHVRGAEQRHKLAATLQGFRTFLQYHVKCSKALFHSQMRARATHLLRGVANAKRDTALHPPQARTITGRFFTRRDAAAAPAGAAAGAGAAVIAAA